ncbi:DUF418 domain-containing protein [Actinopolymorpha alba]|uniref:DUF418 domain-containing protein n=1 Tax=Actinopolymorpha alba TaxID=533267 RepID=UPI00058C8615|nr:DUF418 domain-containing protein [Actinopolymorpha alba]
MLESTGVPSSLPRGPISAKERSLAPDLARGLMLLFIALANSAIYLYGREYGPRQRLAEGSALDHAWTLVQMTFVDGRAYPMFAALFGYGIATILARQLAAGATWDDARLLLRRRSWWLLAFGFVHALVLFPGDILATYAVSGLLVLSLLRCSDAKLLRVAVGLAVPAFLLGSGMGLPPEDPRERLIIPSLAEPNPTLATTMRLSEWAINALIQVVLVLTPMLLGVWAARRRLLDAPEQHRGFLRRAALVGIGVAAAGGLPLALAAAQLWRPGALPVDLLIGALHTISGTAGGLGYAALIGLVAVRLRAPYGPVVTALAACGERSLSCYLAQSVVFVAALAPYAGGLGAELGGAEVAVFAVATWAVTVAGADLLRRWGRRGPAEVLLRRLTYRGVARA